jgi:hypothetical protein
MLEKKKVVVDNRKRQGHNTVEKKWNEEFPANHLKKKKKLIVIFVDMSLMRETNLLLCSAIAHTNSTVTAIFEQ